MAGLSRWAGGWSLLAASLWLSPQAQANDRPFLLTSNAVAEEDDDAVWSVESWWQRAGSQRVFSVATEYAFDPVNSIQLERSYTRERSSGDTANVFELQFKHLFNRIGRDGWGWGVDVSLGAASANGSAWRADSLAVKLPWTWQLRQGEAKWHVNVGLQKQRGERREWVASSAVEHQLGSRTAAFVELGREDRQTLLHGGVRHWFKRDKLALDFSVQQLRDSGGTSRGVVVGIGWYDL